MKKRIEDCVKMIDELNRRGSSAEKAAVNIFAAGLAAGMKIKKSSGSEINKK